MVSFALPAIFIYLNFISIFEGFYSPVSNSILKQHPNLNLATVFNLKIACDRSEIYGYKIFETCPQGTYQSGYVSGHFDADLSETFKLDPRFSRLEYYASNTIEGMCSGLKYGAFRDHFTNVSICTTCPAGSCCPEICPSLNSPDCELNQMIITKQPCPAGYYCDEETYDCYKNICPSNHYCPKSSGLPLSCPSNTYSVEGSKEIESCKPCGVDHYESCKLTYNNEVVNGRKWVMSPCTEGCTQEENECQLCSELAIYKNVPDVCNLCAPDQIRNIDGNCVACNTTTTIYNISCPPAISGLNQTGMITYSSQLNCSGTNNITVITPISNTCSCPNNTVRTNNTDGTYSCVCDIGYTQVKDTCLQLCTFSSTNSTSSCPNVSGLLQTGNLFVNTKNYTCSNGTNYLVNTTLSNTCSCPNNTVRTNNTDGTYSCACDGVVTNQICVACNTNITSTSTPCSTSSLGLNTTGSNITISRGYCLNGVQLINTTITNTCSCKSGFVFLNSQCVPCSNLTYSTDNFKNVITSGDASFDKQCISCFRTVNNISSCSENFIGNITKDLTTCQVAGGETYIITTSFRSFCFCPIGGTFDDVKQNCKCDKDNGFIQTSVTVNPLTCECPFGSIAIANISSASCMCDNNKGFIKTSVTNNPLTCECRGIVNTTIYNISCPPAISGLNQTGMITYSSQLNCSGTNNITPISNTCSCPNNTVRTNNTDGTYSCDCDIGYTQVKDTCLQLCTFSNTNSTSSCPNVSGLLQTGNLFVNTKNYTCSNGTNYLVNTPISNTCSCPNNTIRTNNTDGTYSCACDGVVTNQICVACNTTTTSTSTPCSTSSLGLNTTGSNITISRGYCLNGVQLINTTITDTCSCKSGFVFLNSQCVPCSNLNYTINYDINLLTSGDDSFDKQCISCFPSRNNNVSCSANFIGYIIKGFNTCQVAGGKTYNITTSFSSFCYCPIGAFENTHLSNCECDKDNGFIQTSVTDNPLTCECPFGSIAVDKQTFARCEFR
jgi:hypothetical protein